MQIVSGVATCSNTNNLYEEYCWPNVGQRRIELTVSMFYKISHYNAPSYLCNMVLHTVGVRNDYNLHSAHNLKMDIK